MKGRNGKGIAKGG